MPLRPDQCHVVCSCLGSFATVVCGFILLLGSQQGDLSQVCGLPDPRELASICFWPVAHRGFDPARGSRPASFVRPLRPRLFVIGIIVDRIQRDVRHARHASSSTVLHESSELALVLLPLARRGGVGGVAWPCAPARARGCCPPPALIVPHAALACGCCCAHTSRAPGRASGWRSIRARGRCCRSILDLLFLVCSALTGSPLPARARGSARTACSSATFLALLGLMSLALLAQAHSDCSGVAVRRPARSTTVPAAPLQTVAHARSRRRGVPS
jgi:hypothetical protein